MRAAALLVLLPVLGLGCPPDKQDDTAPPDTTPSDSCPVLNVAPAELAWSDAPAEGADPQVVTITNLCDGESELVVSLSPSAASSTAFAYELSQSSFAPGESAQLSVTFEPGDFEDHAGGIIVSSNGLDPAELTVALSGNAVADSDGDGHDSFAAGGDDCDDSDADIFPGAQDTWYDGVDSNCDEWSDYDQDGDGHDHADHGGDDCDDTDAGINPSQEEVWYDGVDTDCDGLSDYDRDGDGDDSDAYGGGDCDDDDASVYLDSGETSRDGLDDDCDGFVDEDYVSVGDLIVSEILAAPAAVEDNIGEFFELYNTASGDIDTVGWTVQADDGQSFTITESLVVPSEGYAVLGVEADPHLNGGVTIDLAYSRSDFSLSDTGDSIQLYLGATEIFGLAYDSTDWVLVDGATMSLDGDYLEASYAAAGEFWCPGIAIFGDGDLGTPGAANDSCGTYDYDGDGYARDDGDCDESDAAVNPGAAEAWDGVDNDCDGIDDNLDTDAAAAYLFGGSYDNLGYNHALSMGDFNGDGVLDIAAGSIYADYSYYGSGGVWLVDGAPYDGYAGAIYDNDFAYVQSDTYYDYLSRMDSVQGDVDGDGVDDLFIASADYSTSYKGNVAAGLFFGGSDLSGDLVLAAADVTFTGASYYYATPSSHLDLNGDGMVDLLYGDSYKYYYNYDDWGGTVYGFFGSSLTAGSNYDLATDADFSFYGEDDEDYLGYSLGGGDIDGDGYDDMLIGAPYGDQGSDSTGSVFLVYGDPVGIISGEIDANYDVHFYGGGTEESLGLSSANLVADFDNDGTMDVALASSAAEAVYIWYDAAGLSGVVRANTADVTITGAGPSYFGRSITTGDLDADGAADLVVGAPDYTSPYYASTYADEAGEVYLFYGVDLDSSVTSSAQANVAILGSEATDTFGLALSVADLTGDGADDLLVASPDSGSEYGHVWIFVSP
jgi:hypothetical protein